MDRSTLVFASLAVALAVNSPARSQAPASVCPDNFVAFADSTEPLACLCSEDATRRGSVWGMDVYTGDSAICRAALHAGVVERRGGPVSVIPEAGRNAYPGVTRNGVASSNYGRFRSSFRFAPSPAAAAPTTTTAPAAPAAPQAAGSVCPDNFLAFADSTEPLACLCSEDATRRGSVWGMDVYTGDSGICRAALHAGAVERRGGPVSVIPEPGRNAYPGVTRNGVASSNFGTFRSSFRFAGMPAAPAVPAAPTPPTAAAPQTAASVCPDNFVAFADTTETLACLCSEDATRRGSVWGMDVYTGDSAICRAALHAGVVERRGGPVSVIPEPGRNTYPGVTRNGVASSNFGTFRSSFRFAGMPAAPAIPAASAPAAPAPSAVTVCPDNFVSFADTTETLACICAAEATARGSVWGMDVYTGDSALCRAALHAGVVDRRGGRVGVIPEPGRNAYAGVTRNGVTSSNYGAFKSSFRFDPPATPVVTQAGPLQQPIAATLAARGEVQLYVRFRTGSAELDPQTVPILDELLAAMRAAPQLNLALVGHTDTVGGRDYNRALSHRRAEAVRFWLADRGVTLGRLTVDGRGFDEPIADNGTESGRALNRRVQARQLR